MKIVVFSCAKYSDAWFPFFYFFKKFWPDCPYTLHLVTDEPVDKRDMPCENVHVYWRHTPYTWNEIVTHFIAGHDNEPILMMLEDYWLTVPVNNAAIARALAFREQHGAGCVRLYPCPGGDIDTGDPEYALVPTGAPYRISTQAGIWAPNYLREIAGCTKTPWAFELDGSKICNQYVAPIYAFKRNVKPWPIEYVCTAIVQGVWQANAYNYCKFHGIAGQVDWTRRPMQVAE